VKPFRRPLCLGWSAGQLLRQVSDVGRTLKKGEALGGGSFVILRQEAVGVPDQDAAVFVIDPSVDRLESRAGLY